MPLPRSGSRSGCRQRRTTSGGGTGGLRITVVANPPGNQPSRDHHSSCTPKPVELPVEHAGPSTRGVPAVQCDAVIQAMIEEDVEERGDFLLA